jgi:hypothetical protein
LIGVGESNVVEDTHFERCKDCPAVVLDPGNIPAWETYQRCWNQVVTIGGGLTGQHIIGLQLAAVFRVMEALEIPPRLHTDTIDKVNLIHGLIFPIENKEDLPDNDFMIVRRPTKR